MTAETEELRRELQALRAENAYLREREAALRESEQRYRLVTELASDYVYSMPFPSESLVPEWVSDAFYTVTGYTLEELEARGGWAAVMHAEDLEAGRAFVASLLDGQPGIHEYRILRKDGEVRWLRDYIRPVLDAGGRVVQLTGGVRDITERKRALEALSQSEARFRAMFEKHAAIMLLIDPLDGAIVDANRAAESFYGYSREQIRAMNIAQINTLPAEAVERERRRALSEAKNFFVFPHRLASGQIRTMEVHSSPIQIGTRTLLFSVLHDITERQHLEEQLLQAQKMESVGRLAGGIAHDFNNLLTGIRGFADLACMKLDPSASVLEDLQQIQGIATRAAALVRKLLAFARKERIEPRTVDLGALVRQTGGLLRRVIGEDVELVLSLEPKVGSVWIDPGQFEQVLLNLAVNARDAMPSGGTLEIEVADAVVQRSAKATAMPVPPGRYVRLVVRDTGVGIPSEILPHLFEPFFTTKGPGKGTGLGLPMCYGIVRQNRGHILVESLPGEGVAFSIYLPRTDTLPEPAAPAEPEPKRRAGDETVLVVEDEAVVRAVLVATLRKQGYKVLAAVDGIEALELAERYPGRIHLLLTDVVMPRLGGRELAREMGRLRPDARVLFMSGYAPGPAGQPELLEPGVAFLQKPFSAARVAAKVREALDAPAES
jgi:two-component system, cell cycle sensor histidine kinase and response regulator CckA